jgi:hypothetical protein
VNLLTQAERDHWWTERIDPYDDRIRVLERIVNALTHVNPEKPLSVVERHLATSSDWRAVYGTSATHTRTGIAKCPHGEQTGECSACVKNLTSPVAWNIKPVDDDPNIQWFWRCAHFPSSMANFYDKREHCDWRCDTNELRWFHNGCSPPTS